MKATARFFRAQLLFLVLALLLLGGCSSPNDPDLPEKKSAEGVYKVLGGYAARGFVNDMVLHGDQLYVAENSFGITRYDISDPENIRLELQRQTRQRPNLIRVAPWNNLLFVVFPGELQGYLMDDSLTQHDLIVPSSTIQNMRLFPDTSTQLSSFDFQMYPTTGTRVLRCDRVDGLFVDYWYPDSLDGVDSYLFGGEEYLNNFRASLFGAGAMSVEPIDSFYTVGVAARDLGIAIFEMDEEISATMGQVVASVDTPGEAQDLVHQDGYIYVADGIAGLAVIDYRNPTAPELVAQWKIPGMDHVVKVSVDGHRLVVVDRYDGLFFLDVSNPEAPVYKAAYEIREPTEAIFSEDGRLIVSSVTEGLTILELLY